MHEESTAEKKSLVSASPLVMETMTKRCRGHFIGTPCVVRSNSSVIDALTVGQLYRV